MMNVFWSLLFGGGFTVTGARVLKGDPRYGKIVDPAEDLFGWLMGKKIK